MADRDASKKLARRLGHLQTQLKAAVEEAMKMDAESQKLDDEDAAASVEDKLCAHSAQEGVGTDAVGYAGPKMGPFLCVNCVHASEKGTRCDHPEVIADPEIPKDGKLAVIEPAACCNEFHPLDTDEK